MHDAVYSIGEASSMLGIEVGALRRLEAATGEEGTRSAGGQRRYSDQQIDYFARVNSVIAEGNTAQGAARIVALEEQVAGLQAQIAVMRSAARAMRRNSDSL